MADALAPLTTAVEPLRAEPTHRSEQVSEVREGEWLDVLDVSGAPLYLRERLGRIFQISRACGRLHEFE